MLAKKPDERPTMLEIARALESVRGELERRRNQQVDVVLPAIAPPRATRHASHTGLAPTEMAPTQKPRWQYAIGALALATSGLLFLVSRASDSRAASAATVSAPSQVRAATSLGTDLAAQRPDHVLAAPAYTGGDDVLAQERRVTTTEAAVAARAVPDTAAKPRTQIRKTLRAATGTAQSTPPIAARPLPPPTKIVDPDGTIDSY
ncbi:MAG TPA: hypothetical protein VK427_16490 [Kofleriaceae bacterium]|nr:hypothetical protein [Kofleriaceae bacterium]